MACEVVGTLLCVAVAVATPVSVVLWTTSQFEPTTETASMGPKSVTAHYGSMDVCATALAENFPACPKVPRASLCERMPEYCPTKEIVQEQESFGNATDDKSENILPSVGL